jgi:outer membrane cobalamin receptor
VQPDSPSTAATTTEQAEQERLALYFGEQAVVSVPSTREEPLAEAPAALIVITEQEIRDRGYLDLMDIFHDLPGVDISGYGRGPQPTQLIVRGINAASTSVNKIVVLRDGVVVDLPAVATKIGRNLPLYNIKRIEILYGPSLIYGSGAAAMVVLLISKQPEDGFHVEGEASAGSFDPLQGFHRYVFDGHVKASYRWKSSLALSGGVRTYQSDGPQLLETFPQDCAALQANPAPFTNRFEYPIRGWNAEATLSFREFSAGAYFTDSSSSYFGNTQAPALTPLAFTSDSIFRYRFFQAFARHEARRGPVDLLTIATYGNYQTDDSSGFIFASGKRYSLRRSNRCASTTARRGPSVIGSPSPEGYSSKPSRWPRSR